jgi:hypothetical protein
MPSARDLNPGALVPASGAGYLLASIPAGATMAAASPGRARAAVALRRARGPGFGRGWRLGAALDVEPAVQPTV